jgi:hypothetical protein
MIPLMPLRRIGISNYHYFWRRQVQPYEEDTVAPRFLDQFRDDPSAMRTLQTLFAESALGRTGERWTDEEIIKGIARLIVSGELMVVREWASHGGSAQQGPPPSQQNGDQPSTPPPSARTQQQDPPTFPPNCNSAAQAAALKDAASSGVPFCEH